MGVKENKIEDAVAKAIESKMSKIKDIVAKSAKSNVKQIKSVKGGVVVSEKSILRNMDDGKELAIKAPFVSLGSEMKGFTQKFLDKMSGVVRAADQNETTDASGGYLVIPAELQSAIVQYQFQESVVRKYANIRSVKGNTFKVNNLDQSTNSYGGVTMSWLAEGTQLSRSGAEFAQTELTLGKLTGLNVISNELLQDALVNVANYIVNVFGAAVTYYEDLAFLNGAGTNNSPTGVLQTVGIGTVNRAVATQISLTDVNSMYHSLRTGERVKGVWIGSATAIEYLDDLKDSTGRPLLSQTFAGNMEMRMKGRPVIELDEAYLPALGTKGDLMFVDLSKYHIGDKVGLKVDASAHSRFEYDEIELRFVKRLTGKLILPSSAVVLDIPSV